MGKYYTVKDIINEAKDIYDIDTYDYANCTENNNTIIRNIQRFSKLNFPDLKSSGRTKLYTREQVDFILYDDKGLVNYFHKLSSDFNNRKLKTNKEYQRIVDKENAENKAEFERDVSLSSELKLDFHNYQVLKYGQGYTVPFNIHASKFLTISELLYLNKKGLVLYDDLTKEENDKLDFLRFIDYFGEGSELITTREIEEDAAYREKYYKQKKMEIMIDALFFEKFDLDEDLLLNDITLTSPEFPAYDDESKINALRATDRLKDNKFYYKAKKETINNQDDDF